MRSSVRKSQIQDFAELEKTLNGPPPLLVFSAQVAVRGGGGRGARLR